MPLYNTSTAAAAMGVSPKWLDNLLSHNRIDVVQSDSQGVARRLSVAAVTQLVLAKELIENLDLSSAAALRIAGTLMASPSGDFQLSPTLRISLSIDDLKTDVLERLTRAVEVAPTPRRGRPPKR